MEWNARLSAFFLLIAATLYGTGCGGNTSRTLSGSATSPIATPSPTPTQTPAPADDLAISSPASGASVSSPFKLKAAATSCSAEAVSAIGYGLDNASKTVDSGTSLDAKITATAGMHTVHVTAWGKSGAACSSSVTVRVTAPPASSPVPSNAIVVSNLEAQSNWNLNHDPATGSSSSGTMALVSSPALNGKARQFNTTFSGSGGEIYYIYYGNDQSSTNFFYDGWVYLTNSASNIANLEMDMNQVTSNGQTVIYGFQCDGYSGTWDYAENAGTPTNYSDRWVHSNAACHVSSWGKNTWHHIQISYSRDSTGKVTYHSVWLDGKESKLEVTVPSSFALGWGSVLLTNFQVDGIGSGSNTVYLDKLTISRW